MLRANRALPIDLWTPGDVRRLPQEAHGQLATQISNAEKRLAFPAQIMMNVVSLLGKPAGGKTCGNIDNGRTLPQPANDERPVTVTALFYAIYTKVRKCFTTEWDEEHKEFWDSAIKGSSPLRAAIRRRFMAEISSALGRHVIDTYLDLRKFYDLVDAAFLLPEALRLGYDPVVLLMAMQVHLAPRTLRCHWSLQSNHNGFQ